MNDRDPRKSPSLHRTPVNRTGTDLHIDKLLPGEILTLPLPMHVELKHVEELLTTARRRFGGNNGTWLIVASEIKLVADDARAKLREGFVEFANNGGKHVLLVCANANIANLFRFSVIAAKTLKLEVYPDSNTALEAAKLLREAKAKSLPPK